MLRQLGCQASWFFTTDVLRCIRVSFPLRFAMAGLDVFACGSLPRELHWCPHGEELTVAATSQGCELHFVWAHQLSCFFGHAGARATLSLWKRDNMSPALSLAARSGCPARAPRSASCRPRRRSPGVFNQIERKVLRDLFCVGSSRRGAPGGPPTCFEVRQRSVLLLYWCAYARPHRVGRLRLRHGPTRSELYVEALACMVVPRWHALGP